MINFSIDISDKFFGKLKEKRLTTFLGEIIKKSINIEVLKDINFNIKVVDKKAMDKVSKDYIHATPIGMFDSTNMIIYILYNRDKSNMEDTYFHELGHLIDFIIGKKNGLNGCFSDYEDISAIMESDKRFLNYIYADIPKEFFAQSFSEYYRKTSNSIMMFETKKLFKTLKVA